MLRLPFTVSPSVSNMLLHAGENADVWLEFVAWYADDNHYEIVRFTFKRAINVRMLGMGGEAQNGIGVLSDSCWLKELNDLQLLYYPAYPDNFKNVKHYYFSGHDSKVEVLAEDASWVTVKELPNW